MIIDVTKLSFSYAKAGSPAIRDLSFEVKAGEIFGFLGPSGAGKSTTQKILIRLLRGYHGGVSVLGRDLNSWKSDYYEKIGISFEFPNHFLKLTARENLNYFSNLYTNAINSPQGLLDKVGLGEDGDMLVSKYSKGMKTRLGVVRALLHNPDMIFLDEPTVGLDPVNSRRVRDLIKEQKAMGKTVFLTTHDMVTADLLCDRVALIIDGEIKLTGPPRELKLKHGRHRVKVEYLADNGIESQSFSLENLGHDQAFIDLLRSHDIQTIHSLEATLEDVFVEATGRSLS